jgi:hypothetical protein
MPLSYPAAAHTCENRRKEPEKDSLSSTRQRLDVGQASDSGGSLETAKCIQLQGYACALSFRSGGKALPTGS